MPRIFHIQVDPNVLTDELFAFVTDPHPSRTERPVIEELHDVAPEMVDVLECMVLDGVEERRHVADYVHAVLGDLVA
jgi:hypothetical protein